MTPEQHLTRVAIRLAIFALALWAIPVLMGWA